MFKFIKKSFNLFSLGFAMSITFLATNPVNAEVTSHGELCQPANLNQALAFGLGWSQFGVSNNGPIGGGSFFVVCPVIADEDEMPQPNFISMEAAYLSAGTLPITCTAFEIDTSNGGASTIEGSQNLPVPVNPGGGFVPVSINDLAYTAGNNLVAKEKLSVICAMPPQTRIGHFSFRN